MHSVKTTKLGKRPGQVTNMKIAKNNYNQVDCFPKHYILTGVTPEATVSWTTSTSVTVVSVITTSSIQTRVAAAFICI